MYPIERRKIALRVYSMFTSLRKTALIVDVSHSTVARWLKSIERKKYTTSKVSKQVQIIRTIKDAIESSPTITLRELKNKVETLTNFTVSKELIRVAIKRQGITCKNVHFMGSQTMYRLKLKLSWRNEMNISKLNQHSSRLMRHPLVEINVLSRAIHPKDRKSLSERSNHVSPQRLS